MQEELLRKLQALINDLEKLEGKNKGAWKARRKIDAAFYILKTEWQDAPAEPETQPAAKE